MNLSQILEEFDKEFIEPDYADIDEKPRIKSDYVYNPETIKKFIRSKFTELLEEIKLTQEKLNPDKKWENADHLFIWKEGIKDGYNQAVLDLEQKIRKALE